MNASAQQMKEEAISQSMKNLKENLSGLDIQVEKTNNEVQVEPSKPRYEKLELADLARSVYRDNIKSRERKPKIDAVEKKDPAKGETQPDTIASRANVRALSRSLAGMRTSGNEGKVSQTGPNGVGNVGKLSPTGDNGIGNVTNNFNNYYALTTDMTLEEYEQYVQNIFEGCGCDDDCDCPKCNQEKTKKEIKARGGPPGKKDPSMKKEDIVYELEQRLVSLGSTDWILVDQVLREMSNELEVAPRTLSREFKSVHGIYPDKWIKENLDVEICGYMPLEEAARLNKVGGVYEVTFMFRGGTNRLKFFWPSPGEPSKQQMQAEVEKFWPKAKLIAFYPTIDNLEQGNFMVMAPPMTESYHFMQPDDWVEVSEAESAMIEIISEEEGEPISPPLIQEDGTTLLFIEDHETGEERTVVIPELDMKTYDELMDELHEGGGGLHAWFSKSKSKDGKPGWVQSDGSTCARKPGQTSAPKCYSSQRLAALKKSEKGKKLIRSADARKKSQDSGQSSKSGAAKPTYVKTFKDPKDKKKYRSGDQTLKDEQFEMTGSELQEGPKDACYHKVKSRYKVWPSAYASGALVKCRSKGAKNWGNSSKKEEYEYVDEALTGDRQMRARDMKGTPYQKGGGPRTARDNVTLHNLATRNEGPGTPGYEKKSTGGKGKRFAGYGDQGMGNKARRRQGLDPIRRRMNEEEFFYIEDEYGNIYEGKKDACYHKVKSRYSVWPSAYASGALVKCRAKGAKNWGNSSKKEEVFIDDTFGHEYVLDEACWAGYTQKGHKTMFGKRYPNCVKKTQTRKEERELDESMYGLNRAGGHEAQRTNRRQQGDLRRVQYDKANKHAEKQKNREASAYNKQMSKLNNSYFNELSDTLLEGGAWTRKEGQNPSGGLNAKGRASAKKEGHNLKAPVTEKNPTGKRAARRKSFCARMSGMRKRQKPSNNTGKDRLSLSLKKWNC